MKKYTFILKYVFSIILSLSLLSFAGCSDDDEIVTNYLKLSYSSYTFDANGNNKLSIDVSSDSYEWKVALGSDWLSIELRTTTNIVLTASANDTDQPRNTTVTFVNGAAVQTVEITQMNSSGGVPNENGVLPQFRGFYTQDGYNSATTLLSYNGRYIATAKWAWPGDDYSTRDNYFYLFNTETGEEYELGPFSGYSIVLPAFVDDNGVIYYKVNSVWNYIDKNNVSAECTIDGGYSNINISDMAADGSWMGTATYNGTTVGVKVTANGNVSLFSAMDRDFWGSNDNVSTTPVGISGDGTIMYGAAQFYDSLSGQTMGSVIYWSADGTPVYAGEDVTYVYEVDSSGSTVYYLNAPSLNQLVPGLMSYNGRYIAHMYSAYQDPEYYSERTEARFPWIYDIEADKSYVYHQFSGSNGSSRFLCITDDGIASTSDGHIINVNTGTMYNSKDWIYNNYGVIVNHNVIVWKIAENGNIIGSLDSTWDGGAYVNTFAIYYPNK